MFCPQCGVDHHAGEREAEAVADREVTLAKIQADRDIKIAQITANTARDVAETENAIDTARAEGVAEGMETALGSAAVDGQGAEPGGEPIIVETAEPEPEPEAEPGPDADMVPPVIETPEPRRRGGGGGWWDGYR